MRQLRLASGQSPKRRASQNR